MAQGKNKQALEVQFLIDLPNLIKASIATANLLRSGGTSTQKKALAGALLNGALQTGSHAMAVNNPQWSDTIGALTDGYVASMNISGEMPEVVIPAAPAASSPQPF